MDTYRHWFESVESDSRPDFMLIEIPLDDSVFDPNKALKIKIKMIECKMGRNIDDYIEKAITQVIGGIEKLSRSWSSKNDSVSRRYWFTQLYRAIAFSKLGLNDNDEGFEIINSKIYSILNGKFEIEWSGDIYVYSLVDNSSDSVISELEGNGIIDKITLHRAGQLYIQKMLLPDELQDETLVYSEPVEQLDEETDDVPEENDKPNAEFQLSLDDIDTQSSSTMQTINTNEDQANNVVMSDRSSINSEDEATDMGSSPVFADNDEQNNDNEISDDIIESAEKVLPKKPVSEVRILLGEDMRTKEKYYWEFGNKELNNRHLLINGNSGCGKTYCIQGLLMESALQGVSSVVFDYTGGFTEDKLDPVFLNKMGDRVKQRVVYIEGIPVNPFKKGIVRVGSKDYPEKDVSVANRIAEIFKNVYSFGSQQTSSIYSAVMSALNSSVEQMTFRDMADELENQKADTVLSKIRPFIDLDPFVQGENFGWEQIRDSDEGIVYVIQFDGYGRDVQILLTELLLWDIWNFSVKTGDESKPFILVMDEAQNLSHGDKSPSAKILTEGRKFGISGWYATQFMKPQLSDDEIQRLQQAGQKLYFCPPDDGVMAVAKNIDISSQGAKDWSERLKKLKKGECVTCGSMLRNDRWIKYDPKIIKVTSLQERLSNE